MDRKLGRLIAILVALSVCGKVSAQAAPGLGTEIFTAYGLANEACGAYTEARRMPGTTQAYGYSQFIGGYLTAAGIGKKTSYPKSMAGIEGWLENYCQKNPEKDFIFALGAYTSSH